MKEIFLLKLGEIVLKGANKRQFEATLRKNVRRRMKQYGDFDVYIMQSTVYVEPKDELADVDGAWEACRSIFGVVSLCRCRPCEKELDAIFEAVENYLGDDLDCAKSFKVESKRSDKRFPLGSIQLSQEIGGRLAEAHPHVKVDVHHPEYTVYVEVRDLAAYVHGPAVPGAGGLPTGVGGRAMCLLSGGIDSPVAAYMIAKRGVEIECVHFFSYPYTSQLAKDKVIELGRLVTKYCGKMTVNVVSFTEIQEAIRDNCPEEYFTLIMRRFMMEISQRIAKDDGCGALITGENLGQVASQTMEAMAVTGAVVDIPIFMPLVGMDKEEIVTIARKIGTLDTSILPYEDCCTVFTPKHPKTKPTLGQLLHAEEKLDREALIERALADIERIRVSYHDAPASEALKALRGKTLATAESLTGGGIGAALTAVPGASEVYKGGVISYTNEIKNRILGVDENILTQFGAVSRPTAQAMAAGVRKLLEADVSVSVTGLAGPGGDEFGNPVGTVFIGYEDEKASEVRCCLFRGTRDQIRTQTVEAALNLILAHNP